METAPTIQRRSTECRHVVGTATKFVVTQTTPDRWAVDLVGVVDDLGGDGEGAHSDLPRRVRQLVRAPFRRLVDGLVLFRLRRAARRAGVVTAVRVAVGAGTGRGVAVPAREVLVSGGGAVAGG